VLEKQIPAKSSLKCNSIEQNSENIYSN
jgi:hypothetical protein